MKIENIRENARLENDQRALALLDIIDELLKDKAVLIRSNKHMIAAFSKLSGNPNDPKILLALKILDMMEVLDSKL